MDPSITFSYSPEVYQYTCYCNHKMPSNMYILFYWHKSCIILMTQNMMQPTKNLQYSVTVL